MEWCLDDTVWPISRECFNMLYKMVNSHLCCDTDHWRSIELYFEELKNMDEYVESFFDKEEEEDVITVKCY